MNDRIKELAKQAEQYAFDKANDHCNEGDDDDYECLFDEDFRQKFAELIVEECISIGRETSKEIFKMSKKEGDIFEYESHGAEQVVDNIKEHFGIEE